MNAARSGQAPHVDLVVVGGGIAGIATAIAAADLGLSVLLVEKTGELGGACRWSGGNLLSLGETTGLAHLQSLSFHKTDDAVLEAYAKGLLDLPRWLEKLGCVLVRQPTTGPHAVTQCWPHAPGADDVGYYRVGSDGPAGPALLNVLLRGLNDRVAGGRVRVERNTSATALLREAAEDGSVVVSGAVVRSGDVSREVRSAAVALTTGGFENAPDLCEAYLPVSPTYALAQLANTGDGVRLAQSAGAAMWHMSNFYGYWGVRVPDHPAPFAVRFREPGHVLLDPLGHRFGTEVGREAHDVLRPLGSTLPGSEHLPALPVIGVFDQACLDDGPLSRMSTPNDWSWSSDNRTELAAGWLVGGGSVEDLAVGLALDAEVLRTSLERFNEMAAAGKDEDYDRPADSMRPLDLARLYAVRLWPGVATTTGGPRRDRSARVVDWDRRPVPGLLAAGGTGSVWGHLTQHGGGLTDGLVFGRIAAGTAASLAVSAR